LNNVIFAEAETDTKTEKEVEKDDSKNTKEGKKNADKTSDDPKKPEGPSDELWAEILKIKDSDPKKCKENAEKLEKDFKKGIEAVCPKEKINLPSGLSDECKEAMTNAASPNEIDSAKKCKKALKSKDVKTACKKDKEAETNDKKDIKEATKILCHSKKQK
jgi:hypothetical protein